MWKTIESLPVSKQKWFNHSEKEYKKIPVKSLKQWIKNTKRLFKIHNEKSNERKITEFFYNNDRPVSKVGHKKTINQSDQPTTKNYNNNTQHISKDRNTYSDSTYYGVSKYFKQIEHTDSKEEIYQFGETSSESGTKSGQYHRDQ